MATTSNDFPVLMNLLAGTSNKSEDEAANTYAGTTRLGMLDALNRKLGTKGLDLPDVLSRLAGIPTTDPVVALRQLINFNPTTSIPFYASAWASDPLWTAPADGGAVSSWRGTGSGTPGNLVQGTGANQPLYRASVSAFNNRPGIDFDGSNDSLLSSLMTNVSVPYSVIAIGKRDGAGGGSNERIMSFDATSTSTIVMNFPTAGKFGLYAASGGVASTNAFDTLAHLFAGNIVNGATSRFSLDGVVTTGTTGTAVANQLFPAGASVGGDFGNVTLAFVALYSGGDFTTSIYWAPFIAWVKSYYGITVLPAVNQSSAPAGVTPSYMSLPGQVTVSWSAVAGTYYRVYRGRTPTSMAAIANVNPGTLLYTDTGLTDNDVWYYAVSTNSGVYETRSTSTAVTVTPTISGLAAWYDTSTASSIHATGGLVDRLDDRSGNARHLTATGVRRPTTGSRTENSLNTFDFPGGQIMQYTGQVFSNPNTVFIVTRSDVTGAANAQALGNSTGSPSRPTVYQGASNWTMYAGIELGSAVAVNTALHQISAIFNHPSSNLYLDGTLIAGPGATGVDAAIGLAIGASDDINVFWDGTISEIIVFNTVVSAGNRQLVEAYLKAKWGTP